MYIFICFSSGLFVSLEWDIQEGGVWTVVLYMYTAIVKLMLKLKNNLHISDFFRILQALNNKTRQLWLHSLLFAYACV